MTINQSFLLASFLILFQAAHSQEEITPLKRNPTIINYLKHHIEDDAGSLKKKDGPLTLPFFDDFSTIEIYPDAELWDDQDVFINSTFPIRPPSYGVATFDGLDHKGFPYNVDGVNVPGPCDFLTSHQIDLSELEEKDSVYLSFYFQQKGIGENPEANDSFVLEFRKKGGQWLNAWSTNGELVEGEKYPFRQIMVRLFNPNETSNVFHDSFQFRFRNLGNRTGALDHWHLDYVYLDKNRTLIDTVNADVSIYRAPIGLFKNYYSMPWRHFREDPGAFQKDSVDFNIINKSAELTSPNIEYTITDLTNDKELYSSFDLRNQLPDIPPFSTKSGKQLNELPFFHFDNLKDPKVELELKLVVTAGNINVNHPTQRSNDTFRVRQRFDEYFAYDDGSAESGYGLANTRQGAVALKFATQTVDTLKYIAFNFTGGYEVLPDQQKFNIVIWQQLKPNTIELAKIEGVRPQYSYRRDGFVLYELEEPLVISGEFLIGWEQFSTFNLNVGIDLNYGYFNNGAPNPNLFINLGEWDNSVVLGTPLIRPVFSSNTHLSTAERGAGEQVKVFPNPATDFVQVDLGTQSFRSLVIYTTQGRELHRIDQPKGQQNIDLTGWAQGLYLMIAETSSGQLVQKKILKN